MANFLKRWREGLKTATVKPTLLETHVQDNSIALRERLDLEHNSLKNTGTDPSLSTAGGRHKAGSCSICHYGSSAPTTPTSGSIWYDTTVSTFKVYTGSTWVAQTVPSGVPIGTIVMWNGDPGTIPSGWQIVTDMTLRFPIGAQAGTTYAVGSKSTTTGADLTHYHSLNQIGPVLTDFSGNNMAWDLTTYNAGLTIPYYCVYFIKKVS